MSLILVTGGTGFLGSHLVNRLLEQGEEVRVLGNSHGKSYSRKGSSPELCLGDIRDGGFVDETVKGVDYVIHTVSNFRKAGSDKEQAYDINVTGTENILNSCAKHNVKRLVHCSTIGVHGDVKEIPATEKTPYNPCDLYQETKLIAEKKVWEFYKNNKLPISVIRPISMFGPGDKRMLKLFSMIKKGKFLKIGPCTAFFQPAYIDDVIDGFMLCLNHEKAVGESFIMGGEEYVPLEELFTIIASELDVKPPKIRIPLGPVLLLASICEKVCAPLGIAPPLHKRRVSFFQNNRAFSVQKAKNILGYDSKVSLQSGVKKTIQWYRDKGWL